MTLDASLFLAAYPEFATAPSALVAAKLADAEKRTSLDIFGDARDLRVGLLAARLLALSPFGRDMRLVETDGKTVYDDDIARMNTAFAFGVGRVS